MSSQKRKYNAAQSDAPHYPRAQRGDKKYLFISLGISILIHSMIIIFLIATFKPVYNNDLTIDILNDLPVPVVKETSNTGRAVFKSKAPAPSDKTTEQIQAQPLTESMPPPLTQDELLLNSSNFKFKIWSMQHPQAADSMNHTFTEHPPLMPMGNLNLQKKSKRFSLFPAPPVKKPELDFIPSDLELAVLCRVWQQDSLSEPQIYAVLDTSLRVTASDLNQILTRLTDKGLLNRKMISPQHKFKFFILPEDRFGLEVSAKNRRNRLYQYSPNIEFREVLDYLNAAAYNSAESLTDSTRTAQAIQKKIIKMLEKIEN